MNKTLTAVGPHIKTALPGPNAQRILEADNRLISPSYTRSYPLVAKCGHGMVIEDVDGNEFLDFSAGIAVVSTGQDRKSTRLNSSHEWISYAVFCLKKKKKR